MPGRWRVAIVAAVVGVSACSGGSGGDGRATRRLQGDAPTRRLPGEPPRSARTIAVVATTSVVSDLVRMVGSTNVRVHTVVKAGLDPLGYRLTSVDREQARRAELVLGVGRGLEPWLAELGGPGATLLADGLPERSTPSGAADPFVWHDPDNAKAMLRAIAAALGRVSPEDGPAFAFSADAAAARVDAADLEARRLLAPVAGRAFVTTKETMGWFADHYGLVIAGTVIPSPVGTGSVTPQHLTDLRVAMQQRGVRAVFGEISMAPGPAVALARETGARAVTGADALCADGLGTAGTAADTYLGCLTHNARELAAHL